MKLFKILAPILAVALVLGMALPVLAAPEKEKGNRPEAKIGVVKGQVTAVNSTNITINDKTVATDNATKFRIPGAKNPTIANIQVGMQVGALIQDKNGTTYARQVIVTPGKPEPKHHVGKVTAYTYNATTGGSITIQTRNNDKKPTTAASTNETFTFVILAGKFKILPASANVTVGELVTVISHRDPADTRLIADGVVVHKAGTPKPVVERVQGTITAIDTTAKTITIGTTVLSYNYNNTNTIFTLRGVLQVQTGLEAIAFYSTVDSTLAARRVLVGTNLPQVTSESELDELEQG